MLLKPSGQTMVRYWPGSELDIRAPPSGRSQRETISFVSVTMSSTRMAAVGDDVASIRRRASASIIRRTRERHLAEMSRARIDTAQRHRISIGELGCRDHLAHGRR